MKLSDYLASNGLSQGEFAAKAGIQQSTISRILSGDRRPSHGVALKIFTATDGIVGSPTDYPAPPSTDMPVDMSKVNPRNPRIAAE